MDGQPQFTERIILTPGRAQAAMIAFLAACGLGFEEDVQFSFCLMDGERFAACGSLAGNVLKCIAVAPAYRAYGLSARVVSALVREAVESGHTHWFVYTKVDNQAVFASLGFTQLVGQGDILVMDSEREGLKRYLQSLTPLRRPGTSGAVVLNANPFTRGHLFLVETALQAVDTLHLFVVGEDKSTFSTTVREQLVRAGVAHLPGVIVHPGSTYVLSAATFPTYFLKAGVDAARAHAALDLTLFAQHIAPALGITRRFVGEEPLSPTTNAYNETMLALLPPLGIAVTVIPRVQLHGEVISASRVRALLAAGHLDQVRPLVPETTFEYLQSH